MFFLGGSEIAAQASSRLTWLSIRITASILVPAYSAAIISFITISIPKLPFTDLESFLQAGTYKTAGLAFAYSQSFFGSSSDPICKEIVEKLLLKEIPFSNEEGLNWMCKNEFNFAYVSYNNDMYKIPHNECEILKIPKPIFSTSTGLPMRPFSPYRKVFKIM